MFTAPYKDRRALVAPYFDLESSDQQDPNANPLTPIIPKPEPNPKAPKPHIRRNCISPKNALNPQYNPKALDKALNPIDPKADTLKPETPKPLNPKSPEAPNLKPETETSRSTKNLKP